MQNQKRILVFSPHPDDAEIAMGGTILKFLSDGWEVIIADLTDGEPTPAGSIEIRAKEKTLAAERLGITERVCVDLPNRYLQADLESRTKVAEVIRQFQPRWLFITYRPDAHPDHVHAAQLIEDARFAAKLTKTDMKFDPWFPEKIFYYYASHLRVDAKPTFSIDISKFWQQKCHAIEAYQSQFWLNQPDPDKKGWILQHIGDINRYFGNRTYCQYAEPFFCNEPLGLSNMENIL
ncbi:MAG: bacillithiol biosynthesis deacetylase BshB1 [Phycisphaerae bacterium]|nr:bacillithiol biosynthesis deacetylase BshB1 [Phycisphaerae bacterium]